MLDMKMLSLIHILDSKEVDTRAVDDMVKRLRKKLKDQKSTVKIETVWGLSLIHIWFFEDLFETVFPVSLDDLCADIFHCGFRIGI